MPQRDLAAFRLFHRLSPHRLSHRPARCPSERRCKVPPASAALLLPLLLPLLGLTTSSLAAPPPALTYVVGASATLPPGATRVAQLSQVPWASLGPGSEVIVSAGTYAGSGTINSQGNARKPITLRADNPAKPPVLTGSLDFDGAAWVQASGFTVRDTAYGAVVIRRGSHHITVQDSTLLRGRIGIDISDGAGTGHRILRNRITSSVIGGIGVDGVHASPTDRTLIADNVISASGHHGMEIRGSYYTIERNTISGSGRSIGGTSGIHVYSRGDSDGAGDHNVVRYNFTYGNRDRSLSDGNGIQLDQWSDHNTVAYNVSWNNDGAGIILFDAAFNEVYCNTVIGNSLDPGRTHGDRAEIILNSSGPAVDRNGGNRVYDNIVVAKKTGVPAIHVDETSRDNGNEVGPNLFQHRASGPLMRWGHSLLHTAALIDSFTGIAGNLAEAPIFVDEAQPLKDGLRLASPPSLRGTKIIDQPDMLDETPKPRTHFHGAYYTLPTAAR